MGVLGYAIGMSVSSAVKNNVHIHLKALSLKVLEARKSINLENFSAYCLLFVSPTNSGRGCVLCGEPFFILTAATNYAKKLVQ